MVFFPPFLPCSEILRTTTFLFAFQKSGDCRISPSTLSFSSLLMLCDGNLFSPPSFPHSPLAFPDPLCSAGTTLTVLEATTLTSAGSVASVSVAGICRMSGGALPLYSQSLCVSGPERIRQETRLSR